LSRRYYQGANVLSQKEALWLKLLKGTGVKRK